MEYRCGNIIVTAEIIGECETIKSLDDVEAQYEGRLKGEMKEHLYAAFVSNANKVIGDKLISLGSGRSTEVDMGDIIRTGCLVNAQAVVLAHNHPSGDEQATEKDIELTIEIHDALDMVDIQLFDHVIISRNGVYSMRQEGDAVW